jgi:threonine/homoserine/homoserine lactone efflux protein
MRIDPLYIFVFLGLFTPGPNVILLTTSGLRFGIIRTIPHILGVASGVGVIAAMCGLGIGSILEANYKLLVLLKTLSAGWIVYLAWGIFTNRKPQQKMLDQPQTFFQAVFFQAVNPKVWAIALTASTGYISNLSSIQTSLKLLTNFILINLSVGIFWTSSGYLLKPLMESDSLWRGFMSLMALGLLTSAALVVL